MTSEISQSRFYMWRTLFAVVHADNIVTDEEVNFMAKALEDIDFNTEQENILKDDIDNPKDAEEMFEGITDLEDRTVFFDLAHEVVWVDGDFGEDEQNVMIKLARAHYRKTNIDDMVGKVSLEFDNSCDVARSSLDDSNTSEDQANLRHVVHSFRERFLRLISGQ